MTNRELADIIAKTRYLLLDFDGPVCSIFAGMPACTVAAHLKALILLHAPALKPLLHKLQHENDPLVVLRAAALADPKITPHLETALREAEVQAIKSANPTPGVAELLSACRLTGRSVAIVSNNSTDSINTYLDGTGLADFVAHVQGRDPDQPQLMKPHPHLVAKALQALDAVPATASLLGDGVVDVQSAHVAGARSIGYANKPGKERILSAAGADIVVSSLAEITSVVRDCTGVRS